MADLGSFKPPGETLAAQCSLLLSLLLSGPKTTPELRALHVGHPAGRVLDLRRTGLDIRTARKGPYACYSLIEGGHP
jgi:Helix-turn-helix domain